VRFVVPGDIKPIHKRCLRVKWYQAVSIPTEVQTLRERDTS